MTCQSGVLFKDILDVCIPAGWLLPVTPGTQFVTVGGAIANDVHGKNHHVAGTFGNHVLEFELLRSNGDRLICSPNENSELYHATIGGLGLTGLILWASFRLARIPGNCVAAEHIKFENLTEYFELSDASNDNYQYSMAWTDCTAKGKRIGRGIFSRGNDAPKKLLEPSGLPLAVPFELPISMINPLTLKAFNQLYANKQLVKHKHEFMTYRPFFYPLDGILFWNRVYGRKGFMQYQCVIPENERDFMHEILKVVANSNSGSALAVLKTCGDVPSPGLMSFPMKGTSLALDFPFQGQETFTLFDRLDELVMSVKGRIYPAKDAHTNAANFQAMYPNWRAVENLRDPAINSDYWQRVSVES